jgi:AcrR family transcriptional regulator
MARNRRVEKTKEALFQALSTLLEQKRYSAISIQEIIDAADVGRTTFYAHFCSKDELLKACVEKHSDSLRHPGGHNAQNAAHDTDSLQSMPIRRLFEHIQENITRIRGVIADPASADILFRKMKIYWTDHLLHSKAFSNPLPGVPVELVVNHLVQTLIECIRWWIQTGRKYTPQEMEQYFQYLTNVEKTIAV